MNMPRTALLLFWVLAASALAAPSFVGPSGGFLTPNPLTLAPERTEVELHLQGFQEFSPSFLATDTVFDLSTEVLVGVYDYMELGVTKTFRINSGYPEQPVYINAKYRFPYDTFNVAVGALISLSGIDWSSAYVVMGWKVLYGGFGANFGGRSFREITPGNFSNVGVAQLGGYSLVRTVVNGTDSFSGAPDSFFGMVGLDYKVGDHLELIADYNGDRFAAGARLCYHSWGVSAAYVTQAANDTLLDRSTQHYVVGFFGHW